VEILARSSDHTLNADAIKSRSARLLQLHKQQPFNLEDEVTLCEMSTANPTADWEKVGDKFYRKIQLYTAVFDQDLELENYNVTGCSYGGAIGMLLVSLV